MDPDCPKQLAKLGVAHTNKVHDRDYPALTGRLPYRPTRNLEQPRGVILRRSSAIAPTLRPAPDAHLKRPTRSLVPHRDVRSGGQRRPRVSDCHRVRGSRLADRSEDW